MAVFDDIKVKKAGNIFKGLDGLVAVAPYATAALTKATLFSTAVGSEGQILALPAAWRQIGWTSTGGVTFTRDVAVSDTPAWGAAEAILRTVTGAAKSLTVTPLESNKTVDQLYYMADLGAVVKDATNVINWQEPDLPKLRDWRLVAIARYDTAAGEWYKIVQYPRASIQSNGDEVWNLDDAGNAKPLLATAQMDDTLGYAVEHFEGGPGFPATAAGYV